MSANTTMLPVRIDAGLKAKATAALDAIGLSTADAVRLLFHRIVADQAFPLELKVPNAETRVAMAQTEEILRSGHLRFDSAEALFADLERDRGG
jgi:DNA-damage-inducible protein J